MIRQNVALGAVVASGLCWADLSSDESSRTVTFMKAKTNAVLVILALLAYFSGLYTASAFYDPNTQRWLNRDPVSERGFILLKLKSSLLFRAFTPPSNMLVYDNLYDFCGNDPVTSIDPKGTQAQILKILVPRLFPKYPLGGPYHSGCTLTSSGTWCDYLLNQNNKTCNYTCYLGGHEDESTGQPIMITTLVSPSSPCPSTPAGSSPNQPPP